MPQQIRTPFNDTTRTERRRLVDGHWVRPQNARSNPAEMPPVLREALIEIRTRRPERLAALYAA